MDLETYKFNMLIFSSLFGLSILPLLGSSSLHLCKTLSPALGFFGWLISESCNLHLRHATETEEATCILDTLKVVRILDPKGRSLEHLLPPESLKALSAFT